MEPPLTSSECRRIAQIASEEAQSLRQLLARLTIQRATAEREEIAAKKGLTDILEEAATLSESVREDAEALQNAESAMRTAESEKQAAKVQLDFLLTQAVPVYTQREAYSHATAECERRTADWEKRRRKTDSWKPQIAAVRRKIATAEQRLAEMGERIRNLTSQCQRAELALHDALTTFQKASREAAICERQDALRAIQIREAEFAKAQVEVWKTAAEAANLEVTATRNRIADLEEQLKRSVADQQRMVETTESLLQQTGHFQNSLDEARQREEELQRRAGTTVANLETSLQTATRNLVAALKLLEDESGQRRNAESSLSALQQSLAAQESVSQEYKSQSDAAHAQLHGFRKQYEAQLQELNAALQEKGAALEALHASVGQMKQELLHRDQEEQRLRGERETLIGERDEARRSAADALTEVTDWERRYGELVQEFHGEKELRNLFVSENEQLREVNSVLSRELEELTQSGASASDGQSLADFSGDSLAVKCALYYYRSQLIGLRTLPSNSKHFTDRERPNACREVSSWVEKELGDYLEIHPRGKRALKDAKYENISLLCDALYLLAIEYRDMKLGNRESRVAFEEQLKLLHLEYGKSISETGLGEHEKDYYVRHNDRDCLLEEHLKHRNSYDERYCLRIYFFWDADIKKVVIGSLPNHLPTSAD